MTTSATLSPKRKMTSLASDVEEMLNQQIQMEAGASAFYLSAASWCEQEGYVGCANFLYAHSDEERAHQMRIFRFVNEVGGRAKAPAIGEQQANFDSLRQVFELLLEHEIEVTKSINRLVDYTMAQKDYNTFSFLQWFVAEQREEEVVARRTLEIFDIIDERSPAGLWNIDKQIGNLVSDKGEDERPAL